MVNLPRGQKVSGLHGVPSLFQGAILRLVRLNGLSLWFGQAVLRIDQFSYGYLLALGFALVRYWFAQ